MNKFVRSSQSDTNKSDTNSTQEITHRNEDKHVYQEKYYLSKSLQNIPGIGIKEVGRFAIWRRAVAKEGALLCVIVVCAALAPFILGRGYALSVAWNVLLLVALAYGWNIISGFTGYISFGQVAFYGIGAYTTATLVNHGWVPWYGAVFVGAGLAIILAVPLGAIMLRLRGFFFALGMLAVAQVLLIVVSNLSFLGAGQGLTITGAYLSPRRVYWMTLVVVVIAMILTMYIASSRLGLRALGVRDEPEATASVGVRTSHVKLVMFALSAIMPALVGGLVAWNRSFIDPSTMFATSIDLQSILAVIVGGIGTVSGPLIGGVIVSLITTGASVVFPTEEQIVLGILVIAVVLLLRRGLISLLEKRISLFRRRPILAPTVLPEGSAPTRVASTDREEEILLTVKDATVKYGGHTAVANISLEVKRGEIVGIVGANGAGKTTLFNAIVGVVPLSEGMIYLGEEAIHGRFPYEIARKGISRTFQIPRLLPSATVWENVLLAAIESPRSQEAVEHTAWVLRTCGLEKIWLNEASSLSPGQQRMVEFARALASQPRIILLDEVMAGLNREEIEMVRRTIRCLHEFGIGGVAGIEHVLWSIVDLSDRIIVLNFGHKIAEGEPEVTLQHPEVVKAYFGEALHDQ